MTWQQIEARLAEMHDAFMRAKADGENIRRRAQEDVAKAHKFAVESFAEAMVPVKDSLETALTVEAPTIESLKEGVEMTLKQLNAAFERNRSIQRLLPVEAVICEGSGIQINLSQNLRAAGVPLTIFKHADFAIRDQATA